MPFFVHNSHRLFYREHGAGPLLFILPGNTASSACYEGELEFYSRHYHAVSLDFWGTGQSGRFDEWPEDWWERCAYDTLALIRHLGEDRAVVIGSSGGAIVGLLMAILGAELIRAVVADSCVELYPEDVLRQIVAERQQRSRRQVEFWRYAHGDDWGQVVQADSARLLRAVKRGVIDWAQGRLHRIQCPVLLTASLQDQVLPVVGQQVCNMATQIEKSQVYLVNNGAHPLMWSHREAFYHLSEYFLKRVTHSSV